MGMYYIEAPSGGANLSKLASMVVERALKNDGYLATEDGLQNFVCDLQDYAEACHKENPRCTPVWVRVSEGYKGMRFISIGAREASYSLVCKPVRGAWDNAYIPLEFKGDYETTFNVNTK